MSITTQINSKEKFLNTFKNHSFPQSTFRKEGLNALNHLDFPTSKNEDWKYTRTNKISKNVYNIRKSDQANIEKYLCENSIVFINGFYNSELSTSKIDFDNTCNNLIEPLKFFTIEKNIFSALNAAYYSGGLYYDSEKNKAEKIRIIHYNSANAIANVHHFFKIAKNTDAEIEFIFLSDENINCTNVVSQIHLQENAKFTLNILQNEKNNSTQINLTHIYQEANSLCNINTFTLGGELVRNDLNIFVNGKNCETNLHGVYLTNEKQHVDNHTLVNHLMPHCYSNEIYKGVMSGQSTAVFNGKVYVQPNAQKINAYQNNANILLSDDATINTKPELEIYADDVKCSHGSTTGQLNEEALFYLQARGIGKEQAQKLLVHAFIAGVTEQIHNEAFKNMVQELIDNKLSDL